MRRLVLATGLSTFALIILGGVVRVSDSGLGCGPAGSGFHGWPFCNGDVVPGVDLNSIIEYAHRALAIVVGFNMTFLIQHSIGMEGMPRRVYDYSEELGVGTYNLISTIGAFILGIGVVVTCVNVLISLKKGKRAGNDPWQGNTLEWFTSSPPAANNFDVIPRVRSVEPMKDIRREVLAAGEPAETVAQPAAPRAL